MKTPDGREFRATLKGSPLAAAGGVLLDGLRLIGKLIATIWRLAGALDSALWRGVKLFARWTWRALSVVLRVIVSATRDLVQWLPSRSGRAYSAGSAVFLIVASLWIIDELRVSPTQQGPDGSSARAPVDREDPILARIEGRYVHLSEVVSAARASGALREGETLTPKAAFDRELVESYVEQRLLARAAAEEGLQRTPSVARKLSASRDRILAAAYMEERLRAAISDETVERLYRSQSDVTRLGDEVRARHIVVETGEDVAEVMAVLEGGASFETVAREKSIDRATAPLGGEIGYFTKDMMTPVLANAAFSTPVGEIAPPFQTEFGWHVLEVLDRRSTNGVAFESVKDNIRRFLTLRTIDSTLSELKADNDVVYYQAEPEPPEEAPSLREATSSGAGSGAFNR